MPKTDTIGPGRYYLMRGGESKGQAVVFPSGAVTFFYWKDFQTQNGSISQLQKRFKFVKDE